MMNVFVSCLYPPVDLDMTPCTWTSPTADPTDVHPFTLPLVATLHIVCRQHPGLAGSLHGAVHPAFIDVLSVDDDVAIPEGHLIMVLSCVVVQRPVDTLPTTGQLSWGSRQIKHIYRDPHMETVPWCLSVGERWWIGPMTCWFGACSRDDTAAAAPAPPGGRRQGGRELEEQNTVWVFVQYCNTNLWTNRKLVCLISELDSGGRAWEYTHEKNVHTGELVARSTTERGTGGFGATAVPEVRGQRANRLLGGLTAQSAISSLWQAGRTRSETRLMKAAVNLRQQSENAKQA